jgi:multisubunit Na+/H+ antiporter MnhB subunit
MMKRTVSLIVILCTGLLAAALIAALLNLPPPVVRLPAEVMAKLAESGVGHPVTAVLLNFRGYDTLLEIAVLLLALFGMFAAGAGQDRRQRKKAGDSESADPVVQTLARFAAPLMVLAAVYLLWAGAHRPGGAFQAGAVLAAALVLLHLARLLPAWSSPRFWLRIGLAGGFLVFLVLAAALSGPGALLQYPPQYAAALILLIETALTVSLGLILAGLFLFLSGGHDRNVTPDDETCHARFPHPNPDGTTSHSTKPASGQVAGYPPKGEGANESLREFHFNDGGEAL